MRRKLKPGGLDPDLSQNGYGLCVFQPAPTQILYRAFCELVIKSCRVKTLPARTSRWYSHLWET